MSSELHHILGGNLHPALDARVANTAIVETTSTNRLYILKHNKNTLNCSQTHQNLTPYQAHMTKSRDYLCTHRAPSSGTNTNESFTQTQQCRMGVLEIEAERVKETLRGVLEPCGFECHPFKIGWYNDYVKKPFEFKYDRDTLAFILISTPSMFEKAFLPFLGSELCAGTRDPIDQCMDHHFKRAVQAFPGEDIELIHDYDMNHMRRPRVLVQTAGHVSGAAFYYQRSSVSQDPWPQKKSIHGVSIHPKFGGWFGLRGILIFKNVVVPTMPHVPPQDILSDEQKIEVLNRFNGNWRDGTFRDIIPVEDSYSPVQRTYFNTWPKDRKPLIEQLKEDMLKENGEVGGLDINDTTSGINQMTVCDGDGTQKAAEENQTHEEHGTQVGSSKQNEELNVDDKSELETSVLKGCPYHLDGKLPQKTNIWTSNTVSVDTL